MKGHLLLKSKTTGFACVSQSFLSVVQLKGEEGEKGGEGGEGEWKTLLRIEVSILFIYLYIYIYFFQNQIFFSFLF